ALHDRGAGRLALGRRRGGRPRRRDPRRARRPRRVTSAAAMKLATFTTQDDDQHRAGEVRDDTVVTFDDGSTVLDRLRSGDRTPASGTSFALSDVTLQAPHIPRAIF